MILTRRRFLQSVAASTLFVAPAIVRSESLMKIFVPGERVMFRVPDLRGHFATNPEPLNVYPEREMTATEVLERREEVAATWAKRWGDHMSTENARKMMQAASTKAVNEKIDNEIFNKLMGHQVDGVWVDEAAAINMRYLIHHKTGETLALDHDKLGYIPCDGRELSAIEYPNLYQVLGNKYG
jgi:hypothetical protein